MKEKIKVVLTVVIGGTVTAVLGAWLAVFCVAPFVLLQWFITALVW